jgi:hypothetical protein
VKESKVISLEERAKDEAKRYLEELLSAGARKLLQTAIENEVAEYLEEHRERRTDAGQRAPRTKPTYDDLRQWKSGEVVPPLQDIIAEAKESGEDVELPPGKDIANS